MNCGSNFQMNLNQSDLIIWLRVPSLNTLAREFLQFHTRLKHFLWHIEIELQCLWEYKLQQHVVTCRESSRVLSQGFLLSHNPIKNSNVSNYFSFKGNFFLAAFKIFSIGIHSTFWICDLIFINFGHFLALTSSNNTLLLLLPFYF